MSALQNVVSCLSFKPIYSVGDQYEKLVARSFLLLIKMYTLNVYTILYLSKKQLTTRGIENFKKQQYEIHWQYRVPLFFWLYSF